MSSYLKQCPKCKTIQDANTVTCKCGHVFSNTVYLGASPYAQQGQPQYPQAPNMPQPSVGPWMAAWARYLTPRVILPIIIVFGLYWVGSRVYGTMHRTLLGNWETVNRNPDLVMVLRGDGTGWMYSVSGAFDRDIRWKDEGQILTIRSWDNTKPIRFGYGLSHDGDTLTIREESQLLMFERLTGDPPPRPANAPRSSDDLIPDPTVQPTR